MGSHSLLQGIFLTQGLHPDLLHYKQILYHLSHQGSRESACNVGDLDSISGWRRDPFQYSCLENSVDRGAWQATVHGVSENWTQLRYNSQTIHFTHLKYTSVILESFQNCTVITRNNFTTFLLPPKKSYVL